MTAKPSEKCKFDLYNAAYLRVLDITLTELNAGDEQATLRNIEKIIWYGVKRIITMPEYKDYELAVSDFQSICSIKSLMECMTLKQFMTTFPIEKTYDGERWGVKDYYYTVNYIKEIGLNSQDELGEHTLELLTEYMNPDIHDLFVKSLTTMSAIRRYEGHLSLVEEFMASEGHGTTNTFKDQTGQAYYMHDGRPQKIKMNNKNHLKVVK